MEDKFGLHPINESALSYWQQTSYQADDINKVCEELDKTFMAARFDFLPNNDLAARVTSRVNPRVEGHVPAIVEAFQAAIQVWDGPPLLGSVMVCLDDAYYLSPYLYETKVPILTYSRYSNAPLSFLIPDPAFWWSLGFESEKKEVDQIDSEFPWARKTPKLFWRGANSDVCQVLTDWRDAPRCQLALLGKEEGFRDYLDVGLTKFVDCGNICLIQELHREGLFRNTVARQEFHKHRYLAVLDGAASPWISSILNYYSKSLVFRVESYLGFTTWYDYALKPWKHHLTLPKNLHGLKEVLLWVQNHDHEAEEIAQNGRELMKQFSYKNEIKRLAFLLHEIFKCQR